VTVLLIATAAPACSSGGGDQKTAAGEESSTSTSSTTVPPPVMPGFTVKARDYGFDLPPEVEGGVIRMDLDNTGTKKHEGVIVAVGDTPLERVKADLTPIVGGEGKPVPAYIRFQGGVSGGGPASACRLSASVRVQTIT
jgi:hypothetical protein